MWINRYYNEGQLISTDSKVVILYGARRVGKTTMIEKLLESAGGNVFVGSGDDIELRKILGSENLSLIKSGFKDYDLLFIDEAQRINNIGWGLKIIHDHLDVRVLVTGSSSIQLAKEVTSPLVGRSWTKYLYPLSVIELSQHFGGMYVLQNLEMLLVYGSYPETITNESMEGKRTYLQELRNSYLLKDVLEFENLRNADIIHDLLRLVAYQVGGEVSMNELARSLGVAKQTIARYLDLLEKSFIIKRVGGFSRNLRKEVTKSSRYYFYDNGVMNAVINNFNPISQRNDVGLLWENFLVMERLKKQEYHGIYANNYFWRTYDQKEVDWVEERDGKLFGYEFKWNPRKIKIQKAFLNAYENASLEVIHNENFLDFVM